MSDAMTGEGLRVDPAALGEVASAVADLAADNRDAAVLAAGAARVRSAGAAVLSSAPATGAVAVTQSRLREVEAATTALAAGLDEAARHYLDVDGRASDRLRRPAEHDLGPGEYGEDNECAGEDYRGALAHEYDPGYGWEFDDHDWDEERR